MENELFKVTNNGWSAHFKSGFGAIQVGDFISNNDGIIITIKFKMYNCDPSFSGIGFITDSFDNFNHGHDFDLNNNNHSMYLYGNGFYKTSISFDKDLKDTNSFIKYQWFNTEDEISVKINTITKQVIIWNNEINIDKLHIDEINYVFFMKIPLDTDNKVALMIDMGSKQQTIHIIDQIIQFIP